MGIVLHNNKILLVGGKVALGSACCCDGDGAGDGALCCYHLNRPVSLSLTFSGLSEATFRGCDDCGDYNGIPFVLDFFDSGFIPPTHRCFYKYILDEEFCGNYEAGYPYIQVVIVRDEPTGDTRIDGFFKHVIPGVTASFVKDFSHPFNCMDDLIAETFTVESGGVFAGCSSGTVDITAL